LEAAEAAEKEGKMANEVVGIALDAELTGTDGCPECGSDVPVESYKETSEEHIFEAACPKCGTVSWVVDFNYKEDKLTATEDEIKQAFEAKARAEECDCPRPANVVRGAAMTEFTPVLESHFQDRLPPGAELQYIAMCPDYPDGCRWIEETWALPHEANEAKTNA
jgi:hypothetical protein